jgi:hypothetical protein
VQPLLSKYRIQAEYKGPALDTGLKAGQNFDALIDIDFDTGFVFIVIPLPDGEMKFEYPGFRDLEEMWIIRGIYKDNTKAI